MIENKNTKNLEKNRINQEWKAIAEGMKKHLDYVANSINNNVSNKVSNTLTSKNNSEKK